LFIGWFFVLFHHLRWLTGLTQSDEMQTANDTVERWLLYLAAEGGGVLSD
jgi:hypothetical protein